MTDINPTVCLLYLNGNDDIDKLIEKKYQGDDVYVSFSEDPENLILSISDFIIFLAKNDISEINIRYYDGLISLIYRNNELLFSFNNIISVELLTFIFNLNINKVIPEFLVSRYKQMCNKELIDRIVKSRENIPENDNIHYYGDIDESSYCSIIESFAPDAIGEIPILYIKYIDNDTKENGLLLTNNKLYSKDNSIAIKEIHSIKYNDEFDMINKIFLYINDELFSTMNLIIWDTQIISLPFDYKKEFPFEEILIFVQVICNYLNFKNVT